MRFPFSLLLLPMMMLFIFSCVQPTENNSTQLKVDLNASESKPDYVIVIHGGAGTIKKENVTPEQETGIAKALNAALSKGEEVLQSGGKAMDAVTATIMILENSPYFNAGKGAVFTHEGINEMDASIMDGKTLNAGAVGGVKTIKNPITAARAVMEKSDHVMLSGAGAEVFAKEQGLESVDPGYFKTERRWNSLQKILEKEKAKIGAVTSPELLDSKFGTVGCAVLDKDGNLAAGTSTGGMTNKRWGRIGDSPIIGAGTYANNNSCAVSATGHGEYFIRYAVAHDISARMVYGGDSFEKASNDVINDVLKKAGGSGGIVGVDKNGNVSMPFNTAGMYRGYVKSTGERYEYSNTRTYYN